MTGRESGALTLYNPQSKQSFDLIAENATQPNISADGRRVAYITLGGSRYQQLWFSDADGSNKVKVASSASLETLGFSPDGSQFAFGDVVSGKTKLYVVRSDGTGLHEVQWTGAAIGIATWSHSGDTLYFGGYYSGSSRADTWKAAPDGSNVQPVSENCGLAVDVFRDGKYLLSSNVPNGGVGLFSFSLADKKCTTLNPDFSSLMAHFSTDGKSVLYFKASRAKTIVYAAPWVDGKLSGPPHPVMELPFALRQSYTFGNAYDFSADLSAIVYARPAGQADLYLLTHR